MTRSGFRRTPSSRSRSRAIGTTRSARSGRTSPSTMGRATRTSTPFSGAGSRRRRWASPSGGLWLHEDLEVASPGPFGPGRSPLAGRRRGLRDLSGMDDDHSAVRRPTLAGLEPEGPARRPRGTDRGLGPDRLQAIGDPARNGRTIRVGDRFVDLVNNRCYDVIAVVRNRGRSPYSAMHQFELRRVEVDVPYDSSEAGAPLPDQTHFIMRHFSNNEIFGWESLPYFDGMVYNLQYDDPLQLAEIAALVAAGRRWWRYYDVLDYPYTATLFGGTTPPLATWFNWLRNNIQFSGSASHRRFRVGDTVGLFLGSEASGQFRELIAWPTISPAERSAIVSQMVALALSPGGVLAPASGVFLDQAWMNLEDFQTEENVLSESGHGDVEEGSPKLTAVGYAGLEAAFGDGGTWDTHRASILAFYADLDLALGSSRYAIKNADHRTISGDSVPKPWMFENAWNSGNDGSTQPERWANAKAGFVTDPRNLLSIKCHAVANAVQGVPEAIAHWFEFGGWLSFTDDGSAGGIANRELAYAEAAAVLASLGFPR